MVHTCSTCTLRYPYIYIPHTDIFVHPSKWSTSTMENSYTLHQVHHTYLHYWEAYGLSARICKKNWRRMLQGHNTHKTRCIHSTGYSNRSPDINIWLQVQSTAFVLEIRSPTTSPQKVHAMCWYRSEPHHSGRDMSPNHQCNDIRDQEDSARNWRVSQKHTYCQPWDQMASECQRDCQEPAYWPYQGNRLQHDHRLRWQTEQAGQWHQIHPASVLSSVHLGSNRCIPNMTTTSLLQTVF